MIPFKLLSGWIQAFSVLLTCPGFVSAALQNVTVDDAVLMGTVVPQYLPSGSDWNIGNKCPGCYVHPDPSLAYGGTWHDTTYKPEGGVTQEIEFTFTGSAVYIFFITANNVTGATTFTNVQFVLDQVPMTTYTHNPSSSTDFQYNVPVYANDALDSGTHNMLIQPINTGTHVLILFDYLVYTIDTPDSTSDMPTAASADPAPAASAAMTSISIASTSSATLMTTTLPLMSSAVSISAIPTSTSLVTSVLSTTVTPSNSGTVTVSSSEPHIGGIIGGTVGAVAALVVVASFLLCRRRRKDQLPSSTQEQAMVDPFVSSRELHPTPQGLITPPLTDPSAASTSGSSVPLTTSRGKAGEFLRPSELLTPVNAHPSSSVVSSSNNFALLEQVEHLRNELARLHHLHDSTDTADSQTEAPPEYSSCHDA